MTTTLSDIEALHRLADAYGVATNFSAFDGTPRVVTDKTVLQVLEAMGVVGVDDTNIEAFIDARINRNWYRVLPQVVVAREDIAKRVEVHVPHGAQVHLEVVLENGGTLSLRQVEDFTPPREINSVLTGQAAFEVHQGLPLGYHKLRAYVQSFGEEQRTYETTLIVTPGRLAEPFISGKRSWGMMAQLYSVRSRESWGIGDLADLAELSSIFGDHDADFVLINPLHAAEPVGHMTPSPYLPVTRRFFNPIYIRPEDIREVAYLTPAQRSLITWAGEQVKASSLKNEHIDRDAAWKAKREALEVIYLAGRSEGRQRAFERFCEEEGQGLADFALWCAIIEANDGSMPEYYRDINAPIVAAMRVQLADRIEFWMWLQWIMDQQLEAAQQLAKNAGMKYGICHDLAVGIHPTGSDTWSLPHAFAANVGVGAPPDMYNQQGQNWSQPPWLPSALEELDYAPLRDMARTVLRHAGALRIDHVMGLFRLWWIPDGNSAADGTYVRFDHEAMVGVLLLEAHRAGAILIGEDLGTVEPWVRDYLKERGILGTSVFWFEKQYDDRPLLPHEYRSEVLATVNTHDLPPIAGYIAEEHIDIRVRLGLLEESEEDMRNAARTERELVYERLRETASLGDGENPTEREISEALHAYIAKTPSLLLGVSLVDAVGERRSQNQPGTDTEYPNWKIPLADGTERVVLVEDIPTHPRFVSLMQCLEREF